jgi:predicted RNA binding protein YcfA (HicA-like mRNA interferase family)
MHLLTALGFRRIRISGGHHIYAHAELAELVNLQNVRGQAKPYQVRQVLRLIRRYNLEIQGDADKDRS